MITLLDLFKKKEVTHNKRYSDSSNVCVIEFKGKKFVTGLLWKKIDNPRAKMKEARAFGRLNDLDIVSIREHPDQVQAGYVKKSLGVTKEMFSMASTVTGIIESNPEMFLSEKPDYLVKDNQQGRCWMVILELDKKNIKKRKSKNSKDVDAVDVFDDNNDDSVYYMLATLNGTIIPQTDRIGSFDKILLEANKVISLFHGGNSEFKWIFAPSKFKLSGESLDLESVLLVDQIKSDYRLKPLTFGLSNREIVLLLFLTIAVSAYLGWSSYTKMMQEKEDLRIAMENKRNADAQAELIRKKTGLKISQTDLVKPWVTQPSLSTFLEVCNAKMMNIPINIGGWPLTNAVCKEKMLAVAYSRQQGTTVNDFRAGVKKMFAIEPLIEVDGNSGSFGLDNEMPPAGNEEVIDSLTALGELTSLFQRLAITYEVKPVVAQVIPPLPGQTNDNVPQQAPWDTIDFGMETPAMPIDVFANFNVPVIRLESISMDTTNIKDTKWKLTGKIYVKHQ